MSAASAFAVTFTSMTKRLLSLGAKGAPHGFLREPVSVHACVCVGRVKSNCGGGCHGLKSTSVATGATVHVARLTECGCVCVCVSLYFSLFSRALCLSACIRVKLMCCKN